MPTIYILTLSSGAFGTAEQSWLSLDVGKIASLLNRHGFSTVIKSISEIRAIDPNPADVVLYTILPNPDFRQFLLDHLYFLSKKTRIFPSFEMALAYENKGFQALQKARLGLDELSEVYGYDLQDFSCPPPFVYKNISGSGSVGVQLIRSQSERDKIWNKKERVSVERGLKYIARRLKLTDGQFALYKSKYKCYYTWIGQKFIRDLHCDYKVLIFGDRYFGLRRNTRKSDFRASGSKLFDYDNAPDAVLDYASKVGDKLISPWLSLDIGYDETTDQCYLFEYQALNFGASTLNKSRGYFKRSPGGWVFITEQPDYEKYYVQALTMYLSTDIGADLNHH